MKLEKLVPEIEETSGLVQEIRSASKEQSHGATQINDAILQLDRVIQENAATSEEMAASAEETARHAESLKKVMTWFKL